MASFIMARILNIVSSAMWSTAPILTALATFAVYSAFYGNLTPATAFTAVSLFNVLRFPLTMFPNTITSGLAKWGCIKTNLAIFGGMNIHLPVICGSLGYQGFDSYPSVKMRPKCANMMEHWE
jgi:hypothetical protein